jgi:hypothetical protein
MNVSPILNFRIVREQGNSLFVSLLNFETNSSLNFLIEYSPDSEQPKWGATPMYIIGNPLSLFGSMVGAEAVKGEVDLQKNGGVVSEFNRKKIYAFANALSYWLNEYYQEHKDRDSWLLPEELKAFDNTVFITSTEHVIGNVPNLYLYPTGYTQEEYSLKYAEAFPAIGAKTPEFVLSKTGGNNPVDVAEYLNKDSVDSKTEQAVQ